MNKGAIILGILCILLVGCSELTPKQELTNLLDNLDIPTGYNIVYSYTKGRYITLNQDLHFKVNNEEITSLDGKIKQNPFAGSTGFNCNYIYDLSKNLDKCTCDVIPMYQNGIPLPYDIDTEELCKTNKVDDLLTISELKDILKTEVPNMINVTKEDSCFKTPSIKDPQYPLYKICFNNKTLTEYSKSIPPLTWGTDKTSWKVNS